MIPMPHKMIVHALILFAILSLTAAQAQEGDWSSFTLNYNDTRYQVNSTINASNVGALTESWVANLSLGTTSTPLVVNGSVYFADWSGNVYSLNLSTGSPNWISDVGHGNAISSTPSVAGGVVYVALGPNGPTQLYALNQTTGKIIWQNNLNTTSLESYASPILYHGMVFVGTGGDANDSETNVLSDGAIFAVNALSGKTVWRFQTMIGDAGGAAVWGTVAVDPQLDSVYFGTGNPYANTTAAQSLYSYAIISLNATTGKLNWYHQVYNTLYIAEDADFGSTPNLFLLVLNGTTYKALGIGNKNGIYYILDRQTGKVLEDFQVASDSNDGIRGVAGLYYPEGAGYTLNPEIFVPSDYNSNDTPKNGIIAAAYSSNGQEAWNFITPGVLIGSVAVIPGVVFFGDSRGNLYGLSIASGNVLFHAKLNGQIDGGVTVAQGHLLVGTVFGSKLGLYAFLLPKLSLQAPNTTSAQYNSTTSVMVSALAAYGFTNLSIEQQLATISPPAVIFSAFDKNAYGRGAGGRVLVFALPLGYEFENWNASNPTKFEYTDPTGASHTGTISFYPTVSSGFTGGASSGAGNWVTWKELVPVRTHSGVSNLSHLGLLILVGITAILVVLAIIAKLINKRNVKKRRHAF